LQISDINDFIVKVITFTLIAFINFSYEILILQIIMKATTIFITSFFIVIICYQSFGQIEDEELYRRFGIGLKLTKLNLIEYGYNIKRSGDIIFTYNLEQKIKIETELGLVMTKNNKLANDFTNSVSGYYLGLNVYRSKVKNRLCYNYGIKTGYHYVYGDYIVSSTYVEPQINIFTVGLGANIEYFLTKHLCLSGDFGLYYMFSNEKDKRYNSTDLKINKIESDTGIILRFYF